MILTWLVTSCFFVPPVISAQLSYEQAIISGPRLPNPLPGLVEDMLENSETDDEELVARHNRYEERINLQTLRFISVITRHGSRSPTETYPKDPYPYTNFKFWPDGPGQLTRYGKQQLYASGQTLRMRYNGFLNVNYFPNDTLVRTNNYDRDFMSAACLLAGLYPPVGYQVWNPFVLWQPIPIWEDNFDVAEIASKPKICPRYAREQSSAIKLLDSHSYKYERLFKYLSKNMGISISNISSIAYVWDILQLQQENGFKLPRWTRAVFPGKLAPLYATTFATIIAGTPAMARLTAGPILKMLTNQMNKKANGKLKPNRILFIEAAHDATLAALMSGLGFRHPFVIDTSAFMVFELHENSRGHSVQVLYYNNSATAIPSILNLPSCKNPCDLNDFNKMVEKIAPRNWNEECQSDDK